MHVRVRRSAAASAAGLAALLLFTGCSDPRDDGLLRPNDPTVVAEGRRIYMETCAVCHGAALEGQPDWQRRGPDGLLPAPPHDATGHTWHHPDAVLVELTKFGPQRFAGAGYESTMPAYEGLLSDEEIIAALSFIKSAWPPEIQARHDAINQSE